MIAELLGHKGRTVDVFKIDCEGCEYDLFNDGFFESLKKQDVVLRQIQIEVRERECVCVSVCL